MYSRCRVAHRKILGGKFIHHSREAALIKARQPKHGLPGAHHLPNLEPIVDMPALVPLDSTYGAMLIGAMFAIW